MKKIPLLLFVFIVLCAVSFLFFDLHHPARAQYDDYGEYEDPIAEQYQYPPEPAPRRTTDDPYERYPGTSPAGENRQAVIQNIQLSCEVVSQTPGTGKGISAEKTENKDPEQLFSTSVSVQCPSGYKATGGGTNGYGSGGRAADYPDENDPSLWHCRFRDPDQDTVCYAVCCRIESGEQLN
ncbi:MAG: hypothetical protein ACLFPX_00005 [Candidatus Omnitrophota bacterium]